MNVTFKNSGKRTVRYDLEDNILTLILGNKLSFNLSEEQYDQVDRSISIFATNGLLNTSSGMEKIADIIIKKKNQVKSVEIEKDSTGKPIYLYEYSDFNIDTDIQLVLWDTSYVRNSR